MFCLANDDSFINVVPVTLIYPSMNQTLIEVENDMLTLVCNATGYPEPVITWEPAEDGERRVIDTIVDENDGLITVNSIFTFFPLLRYDEDNYTCFVSNTISGFVYSFTRVFDLTVHCE